MEVVTAGAQDELMQSLDYKLKTSNTSYVTARHDVQYFPSSLSSFSPTTSRVCRIPLTSGTSFIDPESIKIAFRVRNTHGTNPLAPATPNPACFVQRVQVFANGQRCDDINYYGRTVAVHDLLKGREYNRNKAMEGFDEVNDPRIARAVHQGGYADVLLRPTMVGILRCGKMLPPQLNLVIEIEFADATTALWSENAGAHPSGATLSTDFEIQNVRVLASQVVLEVLGKFESIMEPGDSSRAHEWNRVIHQWFMNGQGWLMKGARLAVLAAWEQKVCSADCTTGLRIALGSFLLAAHTSMRFGDIQRISVQDISLTQHALRGWATKTTKSGQPWACTIFGLTGREEKSSWVLFWLRSLSISVTHSATSAPDLPSPDFGIRH